MQSFFDRLAILLSGICAIHCIVFPLISIFIPLLTTIQHGHGLHEFWFHQFILFFVIPISIIALIIGFRFHRQVLPIAIAVIGLVILTVSALFAGDLISNHIIPHEAESIITIIGGITHATGHILNIIETQKIHHHSAENI